ncbi:hypothetical protein PR048_017466 [Dryococelus australis]|uniref:Uncharacterized protein n=1 Tax=Dryococelus australis TaxID=614101 RepID=A0ABQ9H9K8_9NEOP|nr:hypothetical protein PR048_017466 [Dryococelus australis]
MVWREPKDYSSDSYFCLATIKGISGESKYTVKYSDLSSSIKPMSHSNDLPVPRPPAHVSVEDECEDESDMEMRQVEREASSEASASSSEPHIITQCELNDLVCDLKLSKKSTRVFSFLSQRLESPKCSYKSVFLSQLLGKI